MRHVRRVRLATAFPFVVGVFSGTLITVFLFLAVRSIDDLERDGPLIPGMAGETNRNLDISARENVFQPSATSLSTGERKAVFLPRETMSFNILISSEVRGQAVEKTWAARMKNKQHIEFYWLPSSQLAEETLAAMKKRIQIIPLGRAKDDKFIDYDGDYQGVFDLWRDVCEQKLNKYHWFVRLKDSVYLKPEKLGTLLRTLNSSKPILIGHSITPAGHERDELGLREGESYCFEGGYAVSWKTLELVCPFLSACQKGAKSENEDVEFARCIREHAGINCTASTQTRELFYVAEGIIAEEELQMGAYHLNPLIKQSILLSPLLEPDHFYHLHQYFMKDELNSSKTSTTELRAHMIQTAERAARLENLFYTSEHQSPSWTRLGINVPFSSPNPEDDVIHCQSFDNQYMYTESKHHPSIALNRIAKREMEEILKAVVEVLARKESHVSEKGEKVQGGNDLMVESILQRVDPSRGIDYFLQVMDQRSSLNGQLKTEFYHMLREVEPARITSLQTPNCGMIKVNFVVATPPVSRGFQRFMLSFENSFLARNPPELVSLLTVLYSDGKFKKYDKDLFSVVTLLDLYRKKYPEADLRLITTRRSFSRKETIEIASKEYPTYELLFLADIHIDFSMQFIERCRMNAIENQQVYFPIIFSPYDPAEFHKSRILYPYATKFKISEKVGAWMPESFHLVCVYNYDLVKVINVDQKKEEEKEEKDENGWNLLNRFMKVSELKVFRSVEPGLVHLWQDGCKEEELGAREKTLCERLNMN